MTIFTTASLVEQANQERAAMVNESSSDFKKSVSNASYNMKIAGRMTVLVFEAALSRYWTTDRRSCDNLATVINGFKRHPRIQAAMRKLLPMHVPVVLTKTSKGWTVENKPDVSKRAKAKLMAECKNLVELELTSMLNHPKIKTTVEVEWTLERDATKMKSAIKSMLENGVDISEITKMLDVAVQAHVSTLQQEQKAIVTTLAS